MLRDPRRRIDAAGIFFWNLAWIFGLYVAGYGRSLCWGFEPWMMVVWLLTGHWPALFVGRVWLTWRSSMAAEGPPPCLHNPHGLRAQKRLVRILVLLALLQWPLVEWWMGREERAFRRFVESRGGVDTYRARAAPFRHHGLYYVDGRYGVHD